MKSMTGFGRASGSGAGFDVTVEVKSVNHKNLSLSVSIPDMLSEMEPAVRDIVGKRFSRGRIRVEINMETAGEECGSVSLNTEAARAYLEAVERLKKEFGLQGEVPVSVFLGLPGVMEKDKVSSLNPDQLRESVMLTLGTALERFEQAREREGAELAAFLRQGLESVVVLSSPVMASQKASAGERFRRLKARVAELVSEVELDKDRMLQELALMAERSDVTEEVQRLRSHADHALETLSAEEGPVGRRLDFILQEMHRELNTMGAKVDDSDMAVDIVEMKSILAALKEQVANVE